MSKCPRASVRTQGIGTPGFFGSKSDAYAQTLTPQAALPVSSTTLPLMTYADLAGKSESATNINPAVRSLNIRHSFHTSQHERPCYRMSGDSPYSKSDGS